MYGNFFEDQEVFNKILRAEVGLELDSIPETLIVSPVPYMQLLPDDFVERLKEAGFRVSAVTPEDYLLSKVEKNYIIEGKKRALLAFLGRGIVEFTDRVYLLCNVGHVKETLFLGSCASLDPSVRAGSVCAPRAVLPLEHVSTVFVDAVRATPLPSKRMLRKIRDLSSDLAETLHATLPFFYMETRELLNLLREFNIQTIDMEVSSFYRLTKAFGKEAVAVLRVSDMPLHNFAYYSKEYKAKHKELKKQAKDKIFEIVLKFLEKS